MLASCRRAHHVQSKMLAAVKEINTNKLNKKLQEALTGEIAVLQSMQMRNIVGFLDLIREPGRIYLVLEYCGGGDLSQYLRHYGRVSEDTARYFLLQLAEGLKTLRLHNFIHVCACDILHACTSSVFLTAIDSAYCTPGTPPSNHPPPTIQITRHC